jgi:hydrogenase maturation protein HypF
MSTRTTAARAADAAAAVAPAAPARRLRLTVKGAVQGVGFRPFVYRLARELGLAGWVLNDGRGVFIEVEGPLPDLEDFLGRLEAESPPQAVLQAVEPSWHAAVGYCDFEIRESAGRGVKTAAVLPDLAACPACLAEVLDPADRRYRYPFTNCTHCGPRFSIVEALPYDRPHTTMRRFALCPECRREYEDPGDRRFHAQPVACPRCGPRLALWDRQGAVLAAGDEALLAAAAALGRGEVVAVKGLGGFQLMVDAADDAAVERLRQRKRRPAKPLALMAPDLAAVRRLCAVSPAEETLLASPEAPIVLLSRRPAAAGEAGARVSDAVAPGNPRLGVMLPYTPLHHLLLAAVGRPVVATSGNLSDEPIATDEVEALSRLGAIADLFLVHDRPIARHADDGVAWVVAGEGRVLRRARGQAPLPLVVPRPLPTVLAVGAHLKNAVALSLGEQVFVSQHVGDMETPEAQAAFERVIGDFLRLYEARPVALAHDLHPDYASTRWAREAAMSDGSGIAKGWRAVLAGLPLVAVQHHHAHLAACLADNGAAGRALGVTWDGTGYGGDGTVWGGEFLLGDAGGFRRVAHLRPFRLPGGEAAVREPRRTALALLWELYGEEALARGELAPVASLPAAARRLLPRMLERGLNAPPTTSAGRLFDGVAALLDLGQEVSFEGQAAMALEFAAEEGVEGAYPFPVSPGAAVAGEGAGGAAGGPPPVVLDWGPLVEAILEDLRRRRPPGLIAARFHNALVEAIVRVACALGEPRVALTGGCFQNRRLTEGAAAALGRAGFEVLLHRRVPPGDGGICLGQIVVAAARFGRPPGAQESRGG